MLLHGLGQSGSNECSHEAHLEIGVTGLVSPKATTQHAMNLVGMPTGSRTKASNTFSKIYEMQRSCAQAVIGHTAEFRHRAAAGQVDDLRATVVTGIRSRVVCSQSRKARVRCAWVPSRRLRSGRDVESSVEPRSTPGSPQRTAAVECDATASDPAPSTAAITAWCQVLGPPPTMNTPGRARTSQPSAMSRWICFELTPIARNWPEVITPC